MSQSVRPFARRQRTTDRFLCKPVKLPWTGASDASVKRLSTNRVEKRRRLLRRQLRNTGSGIWRGLLSLRTFDRSARKNSKGCDIGYALAISSCEEANSVDACTVTALDAITAFAVPNPNCSSQSQSVFSGLVALRWQPYAQSTTATLRGPKPRWLHREDTEGICSTMHEYLLSRLKSRDVKDCQG